MTCLEIHKAVFGVPELIWFGFRLHWGGGCHHLGARGEHKTKDHVTNGQVETPRASKCNSWPPLRYTVLHPVCMSMGNASAWFKRLWPDQWRGWGKFPGSYLIAHMKSAQKQWMLYSHPERITILIWKVNIVTTRYGPQTIARKEKKYQGFCLTDEVCLYNPSVYSIR